MRVIEDRCPFSAAMAKKGKKRSSQRNSNDNVYNNLLPNGDGERDSADAENKRNICSHISKSVSIAACRKVLKTASMQCSGCAKEPDANMDVNSDTQSTWFCLQCGYQGCGRSTSSQHSLKHYQQPHSDAHNIVVNSGSEMVWCYQCDDEIPSMSNKQISDVISLMRKQFGTNHARTSRPNSSEIVIQADTASSVTTYQLLRGSRNGSGGGGVPGVSKSLPKMKGLSNLGNTCFFNAVIQSLSQVGELKQLLVDMRQSDLPVQLPGYTGGSGGATSNISPLGSDYEDSESDEHRPSNLPPLSVHLAKEKMNLTDSLVKLFKDMTSEETVKQPLNPGGLFNQICQKVPRFKGYQQQDSHELLRNLLDALKMEEQKRIQAGILNSFNYKNLDDQAKKQVGWDIKCYGRQATHTTVDSLFGGYLLSSVLCNECGKASQIFESFLDLSLPVYEEKGKHTGFRKGSRTCAADGSLLAEDIRGPSKYQKKKAAKNAKKFKKKNKADETITSSLIKSPLSEDTSIAEAPLLTSTCSTTSTHNAIDNELELCFTNGKAQADSTGITSSTSSATLVENITDSVSHTSRSTSPKSELGYNTDSEEDSTDAVANGSLSLGMEKLSVSEVTAVNGASGNGESSRTRKIRSAVDMSLKPLTERADCAVYECSILSSLGQFTHPELLTGANKFACSFCNKKAKKRASTSDKHSTVYTNARKQLIIYSPPAILTLHLKRFQQTGFSFSKVNRHVDFTVTLDLAPYCSTLAQGVEAGQTSISYLLFAVVEHSGRLSGGHYTAYVRHRSSATIHKHMLQKSLHSQEPLAVLLERVASLQKEMEIRDITESIDICKEELSSMDNNSGMNGGDHWEQQKTQHQPLSKWYHISDTHVKEVSERSVLGCQAYLLFYERIS